MKKLLFLVLAIIAVGVGYWLISPLFFDVEVEEELSPEVEMAIDMAIEEFRAAEEVAEPVEEHMRDLLQQVEPDDMMEFVKMMMEAEDNPVEDVMPEAVPAGPTILKAGSFIDVVHKGTGEAKVIDLGDDLGTILRFVDLAVDNGPDLRVLLSKNENVRSSGQLGEYIEIGKLKGNKGTQNYPLSDTIDISEYKSVIIYCKPFHVVFNSANLR